MPTEEVRTDSSYGWTRKGQVPLSIWASVDLVPPLNLLRPLHILKIEAAQAK